MKSITFEESNYFIFRLIMGMNMMIHGAGRLFGDYTDFLSRMKAMFAPTILPDFLVTFSSHLISPLEFIFGLLLVVGFKTRLSILVLNGVVLILISGVCLVQKWNLAGLQMGYALYLFFLGSNIKYNKISLDSLLLKR